MFTQNFFAQIFLYCYCTYFLFLFFFFNFYSVVLVSAIQQCKSAITVCTSPLSLVSIPSFHPISPDHYRVPGWLPVLHSNFLPPMHLTKCFLIADLNIKGKKKKKLLAETYIITLEEKTA